MDINIMICSIFESEENIFSKFTSLKYCIKQQTMIVY